jgi:ATP-dependent DNA helicase RecG
VYEEFLEFQVGLQRRRAERDRVPAPVLAADAEIRARLKEALPFSLTAAQKRVIREIGEDFRAGRPMRRLLQGDVGSGKTIVAVLSAILAAECGRQTALMAPTEILAEQHFSTIFRIFGKTRFRAELLTGRVKGKARAQILDALAGGRIDMLVGTHALLEDAVQFPRLGLLVVDEQHRFGVAQRATLTAKADPSGARPHLLVMSATPIPRSLALTLYGDLDVSTLDEKPPGRTAIVTRVLPEAERAAAFREIEGEIRAGGQAYVVVPLIEESDTIDARAVEKHAEEIRKALPGRRVGVLHGRIPPDERERTMGEFAAGRIDVLAATTVIEVGVDVPNASYMLVENAERFGLAQLHQLRGRVGRGRRKSRCVLLHGTKTSLESRERLVVLEKTDDGFVVAEEDLKRRGPGDALGTRQSGVPMFRIGDLVRDVAWMRDAKAEATRLLAAGRDGGFREPLFLRRGTGAAGD